MNDMLENTSEAKGIELSAPQYKKYITSAVLMVVMLILSTFIVMFHRNSPGVLKETLQSEFAMTSTEFAMFSSMYFYPYVIMQLPMGVLADTFGPRKTIACGLLLCTLGTVLFATADSFALLCISRALIGMGVSCPITCGAKLYSSWFVQKRVATAQGIGQGIGGVLTLLGQTPLALAVAYFGWRYTYITVAAATLVIGLLVFLLMRDSPVDVGLPSVAEMEGIIRPPRQGNIIESIKKVYSNNWVWPFFLIMPIHMGTYITFTSTWAIPYISESFGKTTIDATKYISVLLIAHAVGAFIFPILSDRLGNRKTTLYISSVFETIAWVAIAFFSGSIVTPSNLSLFMFLLGASQGGIIPLMFIMIRELNDPNYAGIAVGATNVIGMSASTYFPVIAGALLDKYEAAGFSGVLLYRKCFTFCAVLSIIALVTVFIVKETGRQNIYHEKAVAKDSAAC